jgi:hypothetical protein
MPCCGQKRESLRTTSPATSGSQPRISWPSRQAERSLAAPFHPPVLSAPVSPDADSVALQYTETSPVTVEGAVTRRSYAFSAACPVVVVDTRDAGALLNTRFFVRK